MTDWTIILRSLRARAFSTITTVVTVAVAVALMLVLLTMRDAGRKAFERGGGNMHLLLSRDASPLVSVLNGVFYISAPRAPVLFSEFEQFEKNPLVEWAVPVQLGDSFRARWPTLATTPAFFTKYQPDDTNPWRFGAGHALNADFQVVVGATAAREAGLSLGDHIVLTHGFPTRGTDPQAAHEHDEFKFEVVGVLEPTGLAHDRALFTSLQSAWIIHAHDRIEAAHRAQGEANHDHDDADHAHDDEHEAPITAADLTDTDRKITNIYVRVRTRAGSDASASLPVLFDRLRRGQGFPGGITVAQPRQEMSRLLDIVGNVDRILLAVAGAVMISSGIAIMLALYNSMEQRRRQIAVLRVLGASPGRVFGLIVTESAIIGLLGAAAGTALAAAGAVITAEIMKQRLGLVIESRLDPKAVIAVAIATVMLAALAGLIPAAAAYKTSVMRNLRPMG